MLLNEDNGTEYVTKRFSLTHKFVDNSTVKRKEEFDTGARKRRTRPSVGSVNIEKDSNVIVTSEVYKKKIDET